ncbi:MAG: PaaI family thioesterase [Alphaproteobacteria bacterium]|nr:PaaI family thioesterase [Alphaproteobacteria bacterium]
MQENEFLKLAAEIHRDFESMPGLDYLRTVMAHKRTYPYGELLNMDVVAAGDGTAEVSARLGYEFYNPMMRIHGGYLASLMDTALGSAIITKLGGGQGAGTVNLNVHYVRKVDVDSSPLLAKAKVLHAGRSMLTAEAQVFDAAGNLCVHGTGTFLIYPK